MRHLNINTVKSFMQDDKGPFAVNNSKRLIGFIKDQVNLNTVHERILEQMLNDKEGWSVENGHFFFQGKKIVFTDLSKLQRRVMHSLLIIDRNLTTKDTSNN